MNKPYFFTWSSQSNPINIEIEKSLKHYFVSKNNKIFDFSSISFQASFGLRNSTITNSIKSQMNNFSIGSPKNTFDLKEDVSNELLKLLKLKGKIFYTLSGSEGIENAIKISRLTTNRKVIACRRNSYHGATLGAISCSGDWRNKSVYTTKDILRIPEPTKDPTGIKTIKVIEDFGPEKISAFCLETITGGNGIIIPSIKWWKAISRLCKKYKIHLILDEVVCGFGRTGTYFGFQHFNFLKPNYIVLAKAMTGGFFPLGCVFIEQNISKKFDKTIIPCGLTNYAHPLGLAATKSVLQIIQDRNFKSNYKIIENTFHELLNDYKNNINVISIRKIGLMCAINLKYDIPLSYFLDNNFYIYIKNNMIILMPHLNIKQKLLIKEFNRLVKVIDSYVKNI